MTPFYPLCSERGETAPTDPRRPPLPAPCLTAASAPQVYNGFDELMLLSQGRVAFCGPKDEAIPYFASIGKVCPEFSNPAEFYLDLVNNDFIANDEARGKRAGTERRVRGRGEAAKTLRLRARGGRGESGSTWGGFAAEGAGWGGDTGELVTGATAPDASAPDALAPGDRGPRRMDRA